MDWRTDDPTMSVCLHARRPEKPGASQSLKLWALGQEKWTYSPSWRPGNTWRLIYLQLHWKIEGAKGVVTGVSTCSVSEPACAVWPFPLFTFVLPRIPSITVSLTFRMGLPCHWWVPVPVISGKAHTDTPSVYRSPWCLSGQSSWSCQHQQSQRHTTRDVFLRYKLRFFILQRLK